MKTKNVFAEVKGKTVTSFPVYAEHLIGFSPDEDFKILPAKIPNKPKDTRETDYKLEFVVLKNSVMGEWKAFAKKESMKAEWDRKEEFAREREHVKKQERALKKALMLVAKKLVDETIENATDDEYEELKHLYDSWVPGATYAINDKFIYKDDLYKATDTQKAEKSEPPDAPSSFYELVRQPTNKGKGENLS